MEYSILHSFLIMVTFSDLDNDDWGTNPYNYKEGKMESVIDPNYLHKSFIKCKNGVGWKASVQRYKLDELSEISKVYYSINNGSYKLSEPYEFIYNERGHKRYIKALTIADRVVQRSFNDNVINPSISNRLIYDNGASQKGKGISFSRNRFKYHLQSAYREFGYNGYILFIDFSKYFDNILHSEILNQFKKLVTEDEYKFLEEVFHTFDIDVSYLSDEEYLNCRDDLFNLLEYCNIDKKLLTGEKIMEKSVGIGNQTSQATGIYYPHEIDNYCKIVLSIKYYGRYMDDTYIIAKTKEQLYSILNIVENMCIKLGIHINKRKTRIQPLNSLLPYLKINYRITESGRIMEFVPNKIFQREKRRIDSFYRLFLEGKMSINDILQCYLSWYGTYKKFDSKRKLKAIDIYFKQKFGIIFYDDNLHEILKMLNKIQSNIDDYDFYSY